MSSERAVRKRNIPSEASSSGIIRFIGSEYGFPMSFEKVVRKRNMPYETSSPEIIEIIRSEYVFLMSSERLVRKARHVSIGNTGNSGPKTIFVDQLYVVN